MRKVILQVIRGDQGDQVDLRDQQYPEWKEGESVNPQQFILVATVLIRMNSSIYTGD